MNEMTKTPAAPDAAFDTPRAMMPAKETGLPMAPSPLSLPAAIESDPDDEYERRGFPFDRALHAAQAQFTSGLSPAGLAQAFADWAIHLANAPGKQADLMRKAARKWSRYLNFIARAAIDPNAPPAIRPLPGDRRFTGADWQVWPYSLAWQGFLFTQQWWHNATTGVRGVEPRHADIVHFTMRQILDAFSPANFPLLNPEVLRVTREQGGMNLVQGFQNWLEDATRLRAGKPPAGAEAFRVGENVAASPGKVVYRNALIELIQYTPATGEVHPEPVLIVPAWIMKYYILDLSASNSLVRYLVSQGHTVFMISWRNPTENDGQLGMDDYLELGPLKALDAVRAIVPGAPKVHAVGYCLGGTLLSIAAAKLARECHDCIKTLTLFAAQTDFTEAGELMLFINDAQVSWLEDMMWDRGYLDSQQMAGAFQLLRSNDLIWSSLVRQYLLGQRTPMNDMMAWNADSTRMPYRMHSEYLRRLFLNNDLAEGRYVALGHPISLADIRVPIFAVGTERDHIAPWRSVYKITWLTKSDVTFVLASGGHNAGIVSPPDTEDRPAEEKNEKNGPKRFYRISTMGQGDYQSDPETWRAGASQHEGSWWPAWANWLAAWSADKGALPPMGAPEKGFVARIDAPGEYVRGR